ncbi:hypothetical protein [Streptomyces geranii]|uniref:hypothetical protein n=1 Tax=Streptomyces geranii TaxID=2058923 RepID=UPI000D029AA0|nr:hypothetical protein [Streptomyces geranii]
MTDHTTQLARLRLRMLGSAYCNADFWTRRNAYLTDQAVAALARRDPAAAENLAAQLLNPEYIHDTQILGAAVEAGIDTTTWEERRKKTQAHARDADQVPPRFDPDTEAHRLWASLYSHYPQTAAALADYLADLPDTWRDDLFTRDNSLTRLPPEARPGPETAPYDDRSWEDCEACAECQDSCRFHKGVFVGMEYQSDLVKTLLTDPIAQEHLQQRHAEVGLLEARKKAAETNTVG